MFIIHFTVVERYLITCVTVRLTGINQQIVNGEGRTHSADCKGNLILGYNEPSSDMTVDRSRSHNLVI